MPKVNDEVRSTLLRIPVTDELADRFRAKARGMGLSVPDLARAALALVAENGIVIGQPAAPERAAKRSKRGVTT